MKSILFVLLTMIICSAAQAKGTGHSSAEHSSHAASVSSHSVSPMSHAAAHSSVTHHSKVATSSITHTNNASRTNVHSYTKKSGKLVQAHQRTAPNHKRTDNWSTRGNVNPNTGKRGHVDPSKG